jgi:hypothetical protein
LEDLRATFQGFPYQQVIHEAGKLLVVMNDGRSWISANRESLALRLRNRRKHTRFLFLHPKSEFLRTLVLKNGKTVMTQVEEIKRSCSILQGITSSYHVEVRGHFVFNPYCLLLTESHAVVSPYYYCETGELPVFVFGKRASGQFYDKYSEDANRLFDSAAILTLADFS